jgi:hypothetical protein
MMLTKVKWATPGSKESEKPEYDWMNQPDPFKERPQKARKPTKVKTVVGIVALPLCLYAVWLFVELHKIRRR